MGSAEMGITGYSVTYSTWSGRGIFPLASSVALEGDGIIPFTACIVVNPSPHCIYTILIIELALVPCS